MTKLNTTWVLLSVAAYLDWPLALLDVKTTFFEWRLGGRSVHETSI